MDKPPYLTAEGAARLKEQLAVLKGPNRKELAKRLRSAIQMGDLSENADYHKAKEEQAFLEGKIQELEYILTNAVIIQEASGHHDTVTIGTYITIQEDGLPPITYHLVGTKEADPRSGKISYESPIGHALLDHHVGDSTEAETPAGKIRFRILKIE